MARFLGFDHIDLRVSSLAAVEAFYDALLSELGLGVRSTSFVDADGTWRDPKPDERYNVVEFTERSEGPGPERFLGIIEDPATRPTGSRIAFAVASAAEVLAWRSRLPALGARAIEIEDDFDAYPAVFFEDPVGTRLEICARRTGSP